MAKPMKLQSKGDETATLTTKDRLSAWQQNIVAKYWRFALSAGCVAIASGAVGLNIGLVNLWERQIQSLFFELRGPVEAPEDIAILAIDEDSLSQGQYYLEDPERYAALKPIETWPWQRQAYAEVITRLMESGAKAVALDVLFTGPSTYGPADDEAFAQALSKYGDRIVLAADYSANETPQGIVSQPDLPLKQFQDAGIRIGVINFPTEINGQIHRLSQDFLNELSLLNKSWASDIASFDPLAEPTVSFAQATLEAARESYRQTSQGNIFFYGPDETFSQTPFWYVLDNDPWQNKMGSGSFFKDKVVIIGATAISHQDFHQTPFSKSLLYPQPMAGVEVLANTVATLRYGLSPRELIQKPALNALLLLTLGLSVAALMARISKPLTRLGLAAGVWACWALLGYGLFVGARIVIITGTPLVTLAAIGLLDFGATFTVDRLRRKRWRTTLSRYVTSPLIQEIISQQDDFQDLLDSNRPDILGTLLRDHYRIVKVLGAGGFGETYLAQDTLRPGNPICVVKQLKIVSDNPKAHRLAQRLFKAEAEVLEQLGMHDQIPRLLAYFEVQQNFYLVQEMIEGKLLRDILSHSRPLSQRAVVKMLRDLLPVISFFHQRGVIHRDIKPSNIIRRQSDGRYVLIDFGAVKTISNRLGDSTTQMTTTVGIGTQGYMPSEQSAGMPTVRSDIYALGITAIEALTGRPPNALKRSDDGEIIWSHTLENIDPALVSIINKMVRYDFNKRYPTADSVLESLAQLNDEWLADSVSTADEEAFQRGADTTYNQGTRPGVLQTNPELGETQILPSDWVNEWPTQEELSSNPSEGGRNREVQSQEPVSFQSVDNPDGMTGDDDEP